MPVGVKIALWLVCGLLYCLMTSPIYFRLNNGAPADFMLWTGFAVMVCGVILESIADLQKTAAKKTTTTKKSTAKSESKTSSSKKTSSKKSTSKKQPIQELPDDYCTICHLPVMAYDAKDKDGNLVAHYPKNVILEKSIATFGSPICMKCWMKKKAVEKMKQAQIDAKLDGAIQELQHENAGDRV